MKLQLPFATSHKFSGNSGDKLRLGHKRVGWGGKLSLEGGNPSLGGGAFAPPRPPNDAPGLETVILKLSQFYKLSSAFWTLFCFL